MNYRYNPFQPDKPVYESMFVGRIKEIEGIEKALFQTKNENPQHVLLIGERGIGKSSLILYTKFLANGEITSYDENNSYLTVLITITDKTDLRGLAVKIQDGLERELRGMNKVLDSLEKIWKFVERIEVKGVRIKESKTDIRTDGQIIDDIAYSLASTIKSITSNSIVNETGINKKDGLVLLFDEVDRSTNDLQLGAFLKNLSEILISENTRNFSFILAGLPETRDILRKSHESSLRLFKEFELSRLSKEEVEEIIKIGIQESNLKSLESEPVTIDKGVSELVYSYSEGYPHFVQQIGASIFEANKDSVISKTDVWNGFFLKGGALELIGNRYYRHLFNSCPPTGKEILKIMAKNQNGWTTTEMIRKNYKGEAKNLGNYLKNLTEKGAILKKEDQRGSYRLQWASFAFWLIKKDEYKESKS